MSSLKSLLKVPGNGSNKYRKDSRRDSGVIQSSLALWNACPRDFGDVHWFISSQKTKGRRFAVGGHLRAEGQSATLPADKKVGGRKTQQGDENLLLLTGGAIASTLPTDKLNHDQDVTTTGAAMSCHDMLFPEIPCRFENCKACYRPGLFVIE